MRVCYIAGPFRDKNAWLVEQNVRRAEWLAFDVANIGAMPLCPHTNTRFFDGTLGDKFWLEGTLELLRRCDVVLLVLAGESSTGTLAEIEEAKKLGIPIFTRVEGIREWLIQNKFL